MEIIEHYIVFLGMHGQEIYAENNRYEGVRTISGTQFVQENPKYFRIRKFSGNSYKRQLAVERAYSLLGKGYDLLSFNCEDYANFVQYNKVFSKQTNNAGIGIAATAILALILLGK